MAETTISDLSLITDLANTDNMLIEDATSTKRVTIQKLKENLTPAITNLTLVSSVSDSDNMLINSSGSSKRVTLSQLKGHFSTDYITTGKKSGTTLGTKATAEGENNIASGAYSHAEGNNTQATGEDTHTEGYNTIASSSYSHAEGHSSQATGTVSHAEGYWSTSEGHYSHAEGDHTNSKGINSHAEGERTAAEGRNSHSCGYMAHAAGNNSFAGGDSCYATYLRTFAFGYKNYAKGTDSVAFGYQCTANGYGSMVGGSSSVTGDTDESNDGSLGIAWGNSCEIHGQNSFALGNRTSVMLSGQTAIGKYNKIETVTASNASSHWWESGNKLFMIGNGTSTSARSNVFSVTDRAVYGTGTYNTSGADYAEMFEWEDKNINAEDRVGKFVTLDGPKIKLAKSTDDYILGVVSGKPSVCGDVADDQWNNMYLSDIYGRYLTEEIVDYIEEKDKDGNTISVEYPTVVLKLNPDYDSSQTYIPRSDRPEWDPVGLLGKLVCIDDGTGEVNGYVKVNDDSIATKSTKRTKYRVMERLDETHIRIMIL